MVGWVRVRSPPVLESKLLCVSLLYLLTTLPLALYVSFSDPGRRCPRLLLPSFASPAKPELFEYPPGYGERKHALPVTRALCSSPVAFAGLSVVLDELHRRRAFLFRSHASSLRIVTIGGPPCDLFRTSDHSHSPFLPIFFPVILVSCFYSQLNFGQIFLQNVTLYLLLFA